MATPSRRCAVLTAEWAIEGSERGDEQYPRIVAPSQIGQTDGEQTDEEQAAGSGEPSAVVPCADDAPLVNSLGRQKIPRPEARLGVFPSLRGSTAMPD